MRPDCTHPERLTDDIHIDTHTHMYVFIHGIAV